MRVGSREQLSLLFRSTALGSTSALTVAQGLLLSSSLLVNVMSARVLGPTGRGELALHLQISYLVGSAIVLGRDQALLVSGTFPSVQSGHLEARRLSAGPAILCLVLALIIGTIFADGRESFLWYVAAYVVMLCGSLSFRLGRSIAIATARPWSFSLVVGVGQSVLGLTAILFFMMRQDDPIPWLLAYGLASCLPIACWSAVVGRGPVMFGRRMEMESSVKRLGYRMVPGTVAGMVLLRLDRLLLPLFGSFASLGIYVVASTFSELSTMFVRQYVDARTPAWKARFDGGSLRLGPLFWAVFALSSGVSAAVGLGSYFLIPLLFGSEYLPALPLIPVLAAASAFYGASRVGVALAAIVGRPKWATIVNGLGAAVGVCAYVVLIPMLGPLGAAVGSLASYSACAVATAVLCLRERTRIRAVDPRRSSSNEFG